MSDYKISVIIPVYNAQDTIERSINSVINQTIGFSSIELILYDDNSTDNTQKILEEYSEKHDNIVLILSNENSGYPGKGRNEGIRISSADYIMFMDNDDEYCPDMCETLYNEIIKENADIVSSNYLDINENSSEIIYNAIKGNCISAKDKKIFTYDHRYSFQDILVWSKIFKKSTIIENNVKFPEDKLWEDAYFIYLLLIHVNKIVYLENYTGYLRHVQGDSLGNAINIIEANDMIDIFSDISFDKYDNKELSWILSSKIRFCIMVIYLSNILNNKEEINKLFNHLYALENKNNFDDSYLDIIYKIPNNLIVKKHFKLAIHYFNIVRFFYKNDALMKVYRKFRNMIS